MDPPELPGEEAGPAEVGDDHGQEVLQGERRMIRERHIWKTRDVGTGTGGGTISSRRRDPSVRWPGYLGKGRGRRLVSSQSSWGRGGHEAQDGSSEGLFETGCCGHLDQKGVLQLEQRGSLSSDRREVGASGGHNQRGHIQGDCGWGSVQGTQAEQGAPVPPAWCSQSQKGDSAES